MYDSILFYSMPRSGTKVSRRYVASKSKLYNKGEITTLESFTKLPVESFVATLHSYIGISSEKIIEKSKQINSKVIVLVRPNLFDFVVSSAVSSILQPTKFLPGYQAQLPDIQTIRDLVFSIPTDYTPFKLSTFRLIEAGATLRFAPIVQENFDNTFVYEYSVNQTIINFKKEYEKQFKLGNLRNLKDWEKFCSLGKHLSEDDLTNIKYSV